MKKLITLVAAAILSISILGCAEKKPAAPATPPPGPTDGAKPDATPAPEGGAAPAPEEKK